MCRLLGITNFEFPRHRTLVENFCGLARTGMVMAGDPPGHGDGWGLAFYRAGELVVHKSGADLLEETAKVIGILSAAAKSPVVLLHLRKSAWTGTSNTRHAHPFHYDNVAFCHNGVVYDYKGFLPDIHTPLGEDALDTEVFFHHFMSARSDDLGQVFLDTVSTIKQRGYRFSALNCIFSDGARMFAYRDYSKEPDYYSLYKAFPENSCVISSEPLGGNIRWEMMRTEEFLAVEAGPT